MQRMGAFANERADNRPITGRERKREGGAECIEYEQEHS